MNNSWKDVNLFVDLFIWKYLLLSFFGPTKKKIFLYLSTQGKNMELSHLEDVPLRFLFINQ